MEIGLLGKKIGMTRIYDLAGDIRSVTAIEFGINKITQLKSNNTDGYNAVQIGFQTKKSKIIKAEKGHLLKSGIKDDFDKLSEFRVNDIDSYNLGQEISINEISSGQYINVSSTSKGRGFAGGVKRWNFRGGPKTHGQSDRHRAPGSIGAGSTPGKVWKGQKMAGHMGNVLVTNLNLLVVKVDLENNIIFVNGSVPGHNNCIVKVTNSRKKPNQKLLNLAEAAAEEVPVEDKKEDSSVADKQAEVKES
jgi:large subunit ribosomal protein L3|tara:strand:- start:686 stop:1429 length:744 start_codon:yes stop_codon:yes gene_type:complete